MRTTTKLKKILEKNVVGLSMSNGELEMSVISVDRPVVRNQYSHKTFSALVSKAYNHQKNI